MTDKGKRALIGGSALLAAFAIWTALICTVDVRAVGPMGSKVGFAGVNTRFHSLTGVNMTLYEITDWLGLVPIGGCVFFGCLGLVQLIRRRSLFKVDADILILGAYYLLVIFCYLIFEMIPINYRPVLIGGYLEASYPSSTTLLVLSVMPTLIFQAGRRVGSRRARYLINISAAVFAAFMVIGRLISGVHWATDIAGSVLLSSGLFMIYIYAVDIADSKGNKNGIQRKITEPQEG